MLVPILLSVFWAICSTVLIQPWFWKGLIKRKTIIGDKDNRGFSSDSEADEPRDTIRLQIFFGVVTLVISLIMYLLGYVRYNFYGAIFPILLVLLFQGITIHIGWNEKRKIKTFIILAIAVVCVFFSITDALTSDFDVIGIGKSYEELPIVTSNAISSLNVADLFEADSASGPVYSNGKFVYTISGSRNGYGIVTIDENNGETAKFYACNFEFGMSSALRQKYPFARIRELNVVISDDNVPFGKYAILNKPNMFGAPVLDKYVLQNMLTGEFTEYTAEELPKFAE